AAADESSPGPDLSSDISEYFIERAHINEKELQTTAAFHLRLIERLLQKSPTNAAFRYAYGAMWTRTIDTRLLGDPERHAEALTPNSHRVETWAILESIEAIFQAASRADGKEVAKPKLEAMLPVFDRL